MINRFSEIKAIRGNVTAFGIIDYLDRIEKRMTDKVISNKEYTTLIVVSANWVYFVGANLVFALSDRANTRFAPTIA